MEDPLHVPASAKIQDTDYQWMDPEIRKNPEATGWQRMARLEMPLFPSDDEMFIKCGALWLYKRPLALTQRVQKGEQAVAIAMRDDPSRGAQVARPLTSPRGPFPGKRNLRDVWLFCRVWLRGVFGRPNSQRLVEKWLRVNAVGLRRWSDENSVTLSQYVDLHTKAILEGKGRWPGQIIRSVSRPLRNVSHF